MQYVYDEILGRMVYTVVDKKTQVAEAIKLANEFKKLNSSTREYLLARLTMVSEEMKDNA